MTKDRLVTLQKSIDSDENVLQKLSEKKATVEQEIESLQSQIEDHRSRLKTLLADLEQRTKSLEEVKKVATKAGKGLDNALKEISSMVGSVIVRLAND